MPCPALPRPDADTVARPCLFPQVAVQLHALQGVRVLQHQQPQLQRVFKPSGTSSARPFERRKCVSHSRRASQVNLSACVIFSLMRVQFVG